MKPAKLFQYSIYILPLVFLWAGLNMELAKFGNDPNYVYLVNATAICSGKWVGYIDHPGTPVMQIGALTIALKHLFSNPGNEKLAEHVFGDSQAFIQSISNVLVILNSLVLLFLGWFTLRKTKSIGAALLLQIATFITANTLDHAWTKVSPEPFLFFLSCLFVIVVLQFYYSSNRKAWKYVFIFALISGAGLGTKATFLPLVFLPLVVLPSIKKKLVYLLLIPLAFVLFTIPIIPEYENMYYWFRGLSSHSGIYGHGKKGFIDFETYLPNIVEITKSNAIFVGVTIVSSILVAIELIKSKGKIKTLSTETVFLAGLSISSGIGILMVAKHYHVNHYLIPVLLLTGISVLFIFKVVFKTQKGLFSKIALPFVVVLFFVFVGYKIPDKINYANEGYKLTNEEMDKTNKRIEKEYVGYTKVYYYPNAFYPYSGLNFGDVYCQRRMLPEIQNVHGDIYFYHSFEHTVKNWNQAISLDHLIQKQGKKILLVGGPFNSKDAGELWKHGFPVKEIYDGRIQAIYELDTLQYNRAAKDIEENLEWSINCDMEEVNSNDYFVGNNLEEFGKAVYRSGEKARSGNYAIKFDKTREFAMEYKLKDLKQGDQYEIEVWKFADNESVRLVAAANDSKKFYKTQRSSVFTDDNGWELLNLKFTIPDSIEGETIKIYLWNADNKTGYFDDFSVKKWKKSE